MIASHLRLVVVTPEKTLLDEPVSSLQFPLFDGQMGVLPGRAPVVGRLGMGELTLEFNGATRRFYIDGGFVQIKGSTVSLLTHRAIPAEEVDAKAAEDLLHRMNSFVAKTPEEVASKSIDLERARKMLRVARNS